MAGTNRKISDLDKVTTTESTDEIVLYRPTEADDEDQNKRIDASRIGGGGGGAGGVFAPIYRSGSTTRGIEVGLNKDAGWALVSEARDASAGTLPTARLRGETTGARLDLELPRTLVSSEDGNDWVIQVEQGIEDVTAVAEVLPSASLAGGTAGASIGLEIPNDLATPADGNDWDVRVEQGAEDTQAVDATLPSATLDGETTGSSIEVTIPEDLVAPTDGNDWDVRIHQVREFQPATTARRAHYDLVFTSGPDAGKGVRMTLAGTHSSSMGAAGNNVVFSLAVGTSVNASAFTTFYNMTAVPGTSTLAQIFTEADVGGNNYQFDAEYIGGADGTEVVQSGTFPFGVSGNFEGGQNTAASVAGGTLEASISTANERITIRTKSTDTVGAIAAVLHALSYTDMDGATQTFGAAGAVVTGTGFLNETTYYSGDTGDTVDVGFDGGVDAIAFAAGDLINVVLNATDERIEITANSTDTINNIAALLQALAYTDLDGNAQTFGSSRITLTGSGTLSNATFFDGAVGDTISTDFTGGVDEVDGVVGDVIAAAIDAVNERITLLVQSNHTLTNIRTALAATTYDDEGSSRALGTTNVVLTGSGASGLDESDYFAGAVGATADSNFAGGVDPEPLAAVIDNTAKTVTVHYDVSADTLSEVRDALLAVAGVSAALVRSTLGTAAPEAAGFTRTFRGDSASAGGGSFDIDGLTELDQTPADNDTVPIYDETAGASRKVPYEHFGGGGGSGVTVEDSGTEEGTSITTLNFDDNLDVSVAGTEATITGPDGSLSRQGREPVRAGTSSCHPHR